MATQGKLNVVIGADTTPMTAGLSRAAASLRGFLTLGLLAGAAREAIAYGSAINDIGMKSQVGVKWLQATAYAAKMAGSSMEDLGAALVDLRRAQAQALGGSEGDLGAFQALGVTLEELRTLSTEGLFDRVADAVTRSKGGIVEMNAALQVMGRGGKGLVGAMVEGFSEARAEAERLGFVLEESTIRAMDELGDRLDMLKTGLTALSAVLLKNMTSWANWVGLFKTLVNLNETPRQMLGAFIGGGMNSIAALSAVGVGIAGWHRQMRIIDEYQAAADKEDEEFSARSSARGRMPATMGKRRRSEIDAVNSLARLGLYTSGAAAGGNALLRVQNQALVELRQMSAALERMANRQPGQSITW